MCMASSDAARLRRGVILTGGADGYRASGIHSVRALAPVANEPIVSYALADLAKAGIEEVALLVSPDAQAAMREVVGNGSRWGVRAQYVPHPDALGDARSLLAVEEFTHGLPFVVHRGDGFLRPALRALLEEFDRDQLDALVVVERSAVGSLYVVPAVERGTSGRSAAMHPDARSQKAHAGVQAFRASVFDAIRELADGRRGPLDLARVADKIAARGGVVETRAVEGWWTYDGSPAELLSANRLRLDELTADLRGVDVLDSRVEGRVAIDPSATLTSTTVRGPAIIGPRACLSHAYVGPYTSLGAGVVVDGAEVEDSIILPGAIIRHLGRRLEGSVVGREAKVHRDFALPAGLRLWVGDGVEVSLG